MSGATLPPAFPVVLTHDTAFADHGMTLLDWFAAMAMQARITHPDPAFVDQWALTAEWSYEMADAMMAERERRK